MAFSIYIFTNKMQNMVLKTLYLQLKTFGCNLPAIDGKKKKLNFFFFNFFEINILNFYNFLLYHG